METLSDLNWFNGNKFKANFIQSLSPKLLGASLDHLELRAICHQDKIVTTGDLLNIQGDDSAFDGTETIFDGTDEHDDFDAYPTRVSASQIISFLAKRFQQRQSDWQEIWPFELEVSQRGFCTITFDPEHEYAKVYTYFLLALYAKYIEPTNIANEYRSTFEFLCYELVKVLFPESSGWVVKQSGTGISGVNAYAGNKLEKLKAISKDLYLSAQEGRLLTTSGDGGIDLIAFHKLYDTRGKLPVIFMQCACSSDISEFEDKILEVAPARLKGLLNLDIAHEFFLFSPYDWFDHLQRERFVVHNNDAVIFDRTRILKTMHALEVPLTENLPEEITLQIEEFINTKESFI